LHRQLLGKIPANCRRLRTRIRGKLWLVVEVPKRYFPRSKGDDFWGLTVYDDQIIYLRRGLPQDIFVDALLHEVIHAFMGDLHEQPVGELATNLARIAFRFGVQRIDPTRR
jgi:hypothetical protein